jgi:hypothetical protein
MSGSPTQGISLINVESGSDGKGITLWAIWTTGSPSPVTNLTLTALNAQSQPNQSDVVSMTYSSKSPLKQGNGNFVSIATNTTSTMVYIWTVDPSKSPDVASVVASQFDATGQLVPGNTTTVQDNNSGYIIQNISINDSNNRAQYYVYNKRPLQVINNSNSTITVQTVGLDTRFVSVTGSNAYTFPSSTSSTDITSAVASIASGTSNTSKFTPAFPSKLYTGAYVWSGSTPSTGATADYALSFQPANYARLRSSATSPPTLSGAFDPDKNTLTITTSGSTPSNGTKINGQTCSANIECISGNCSSGVCKPPGTTSDTGNNGGLPWWGWLLIILGVVLVIGFVIFLIYRGTKGSGDSGTPDLPPSTTTTTAHTTVVHQPVQ